MVERKEYLDQLWAWKDEQQIKVVTGIRRCGKSVLLEQYQQKLLAEGVAPEQIISINFENLDYEPLKDYMELYRYLKERLCTDKMTYIFLDEVQEVPSFEKVVDSLSIKDQVDIYITGSNAYMLSSELATLLSGRYTEIKMLPFSFREYIAETGLPKEEAFAEFMKAGGIPYVAAMNRTDEKVDQYLEGIYNTVIVKDIEQRQLRKEKEGNTRKITDIALLKNIARYLASVIGSPVSMKSITNYLTSSGRKISQNTVSDYVDALKESFIFYSVERFDIVGKQLLKINNKLYMVDMGIRNHILPRKRYDLGFTIENIVFLELMRKGYKINIGKYGATEVDFVVQKEGVLTYYQVTADMTAKETFEREMRPLRSIPDNYEKVVLTLDHFSLGNYDGIKVVNVIDWLLR
ncbi:ATP-binding protein [Roseburia sp. AM59-24XD]|jgi:predicted AAA+ superfamily ATPase|uniref:ATP-binding protein n=1 Tax=Roseburia sp. AM59-24XD TaxID=2293138 RepID=UPI000E49EC0B|nr:ATP-binding protein [Roseburia sp. AM59-24XD]RHP80789.1 ATP-binding protein [Roseburia sp. AM59-24XD]